MKYLHIDDINLPELEVYTKLSEVQLLRYFEPDIGVFVSESANVVLRALEAGYEPISLLVEDERLEKEARPVIDMIENICPQEIKDKVTVYIAGHELLKDLTGYALVRGLWAVLRRKPLPALSDFCKNKNKLAVLYDIMNPTNAGAIIRSAAALGVDGVVLTSGSVNPLSRRSARVSMGTVFQVPWTFGEKEDGPGIGLIKQLHESGYTTVAMALTDDSLSVDDSRLKEAEKIAIVLGTEGDGLPKEVIKACTYTVKIPMQHNVDSLNVAAASAVAFWEILKQ
jgi:tRNA G18 (ribose-2'-O)-methylase SpoU